ncbi:antibiotic biosynthesis monooxygenase [Streptomyces cucumeris]|uniref:antibiotic biosynthesis monooxygenase n=1 Tax=Streptomyces cucumeris TaxID=2962890 RepID=UPI003D7496AF
MSDIVYALFHYRVKPGKEELFESAVERIFSATEAGQPYVFICELYQAPDGSYYQVERYENEEAVWKHMEIGAEPEADWAEATEILQLTMLGNLTQKFRDHFLEGEGTKFKPVRAVKR